jgi:hypothetical protein
MTALDCFGFLGGEAPGSPMRAPNGWKFFKAFRHAICYHIERSGGSLFDPSAY